MGGVCLWEVSAHGSVRLWECLPMGVSVNEGSTVFPHVLLACKKIWCVLPQP